MAGWGLEVSTRLDGDKGKKHQVRMKMGDNHQENKMIFLKIQGEEGVESALKGMMRKLRFSERIIYKDVCTWRVISGDHR